MYPGKYFRGRKAVRSAAVVFSLTWAANNHAAQAATESVWSNTATTGIWNTGTSWSAGTPQAGWVGSVLRGVNINFNLTSATTIDFGAVQLAGGTALVPAELTLNTANVTSPFFDAGTLVLGGSYTPVLAGASTGIGPGEVAESAGTITIDSGGLLAVDPISTFILSGTGTLKTNNEQLFGTFSQSGSSNNNVSTIVVNNVSSGSIITNCGTYTLSGGINSADTFNNTTSFNSSNSVTYTGVYNQSGGTLQGSTGSNISFNNSSAYIYSGGTFTGTMINNLGATININSATIPFSQGLLDNGRMTVTGGTGTYAGPISGNGTMVFNGATSITLTGSSTFTGQTTITAGTVFLAGPSPTNGSGGSINGNVGISSAGTLQTNADSQIANTSLVSINGGTLNLGGHNESIGSLNMTNGQVTQTTGPGLGVATGQITINRGSSSITGGLQSNALLNFNISSSGLLSVGGIISGYNSAAGSLYLTGGGGLTITANSYLSSIDVQSGQLQISEGGTFGGAGTAVTVETSGTMNINNQVVTIGNLTGAGTLGLGSGVLNVTGSGTFAGSITGTGTLNKAGAGILTLSGSDSSTGVTNVSTGTLTVTGSIAGSSINVAAGTTANLNGTINNNPNVNANGTVSFGANSSSGILVQSIAALTIGSNATAGNGQVNVLFAPVHANRNLLVTTGVTLSGGNGAWTSKLDLSNNDLVIHNGQLPTVSNQVKSGFANGQWTGNGITSSAAAADANHLTALGAILNDDGTGTPLYSSSPALGLFDGMAPSVTDVLVKFTYYGDANLDGKVDGSDYSRIDSSFISQTPSNPISGWYNGDFNYDGIIDGSDYTLIDNAFNTQGGNLSTSAEIAQVTSEIAGISAVPEPTSTAAMIALGLATLRRRRRKN